MRYSDGSGSKVRPVIVVSVRAVHEVRADAVVLPLTTNLEVLRLGDHVLRDWQAAGLPRESLVKPMPQTVAQLALHSRLGRISEHDLAAIESALREVLGL